MKLLIIKYHQKCLFTIGFAKFCRSRAFASDERREGRPKSAVIPSNIDSACKVIEEYMNVTYRKIKAPISISRTALQ